MSNHKKLGYHLARACIFKEFIKIVQSSYSAEKLKTMKTENFYGNKDEYPLVSLAECEKFYGIELKGFEEVDTEKKMNSREFCQLYATKLVHLRSIYPDCPDEEKFNNPFLIGQ